MDIPALPDIERVQDLFESQDAHLRNLPPIWSKYIIPALPDKPQNPIMDHVHLSGGSQATGTLESAQRHRDEVAEDESVSLRDRNDEDIWIKATREPRRLINRVLSWDTFSPSADRDIFEPSFLSQRSPRAFSAARQYVAPEFRNPFVKLVYTTPQELFQSVCMSLTGLSSPLHVWDSVSQTFVLREAEDGKTGELVIDTIDKVVSQSLLQRFLSIGTLSRRLESLVAELRQNTLNEPCRHAFAHALSSILHAIKKRVRSLGQIRPKDASMPNIHSLSALWTACADIEFDLACLGSLCGRHEEVNAGQYRTIPNEAAELLSIIYQQLDFHVNHHSPRTTTATFAFLLSGVSADYLASLCRSVGYSRPDLSSPIPTGGTNARAKAELNLDGEDAQDDDVVLNKTSEIFPVFFSPELHEALTRARQSLKLLRVAQPDHTLLHRAQTQREIRWLWTEAEIDGSWLSYADGTVQAASVKQVTKVKTAISVEGDSKTKSDILQAFQIFDLEPGTHPLPVAHSTSPPAIVDFDQFLNSFPEALPSITPTLTDLTDLVLSPLVTHINTLHGALIDVFLVPGSYLNILTHLKLLRSYILLTSQAFKSRLQASLFSDVPEPPPRSTIHSLAFHRSSSASTGETGVNASHSVIGLASGLTEGDWPPAGADLSYLLRTVIIDSLDIDHPDRQLSELHGAISREEVQIFEEAEWRLGFAIRDLPTGSGHAKWLDPRAIEALDFLYIDYQPPRPLDVLIPPSTLSKYQRLFAFNLRLMRVECVVNALFRMSSRGMTPPFATLSQSQKTFLHFRFLASSFIASLSSYVYDTAIGGTLDKFLAKVADHSQRRGDRMFQDVFALEDYHSRVMDDILSSCLLRSGQKVVGELLRSVMDIVLQFGILMSDRQRGVIEEYEAAEPLEELFRKFIKRLRTLVKVLKSLVEKGNIASRVPLENVQIELSAETLVAPQAVGVAANLHDLFVRLDVSSWWTRGQQT